MNFGGHFRELIKSRLNLFSRFIPYNRLVLKGVNFSLISHLCDASCEGYSKMALPYSIQTGSIVGRESLSPDDKAKSHSYLTCKNWIFQTFSTGCTLVSWYSVSECIILVTVIGSLSLSLPPLFQKLCFKFILYQMSHATGVTSLCYQARGIPQIKVFHTYIVTRLYVENRIQ